MKKFLILCGNAMAALMDFGVGMLIVSLIEWAFGIKIPYWQYLAGGALALLPDFDVLLPIILKGSPTKEEHHHETIMHRPAFLLPVAAMTGYLIGGNFWAITTVACVFWHFLHDSPEFGGGGIAWFWPVSKKYWSIIGPFEPLPRTSNREETHYSWLEEKWLRPTKTSAREVGIGTVALAMATGPAIGIGYAFVAYLSIWGTIFVVWHLHSKTQTKE